MARKIRQQTCKNCEHSFRIGENFCPNCGQENHSPNQPIKHYGAELIESILHLDSKFLFTIATFLKHPGKITKEYNENKRARYTPPVKLYVFVSLVFFILLQISPKLPSGTQDHTSTNQTKEDSIITRKDSLADIEPKQDSHHLQQNVSLGDSSHNVSGLQFDFRKDEISLYKSATPEQMDSIIRVNNLTPNYFTRTIFKQIVKSLNPSENFGSKVKEKTLKFVSFSMFFLMPVFAFILGLMYLKQKRFYYEYLIFSIHYHTLVFFILSIIIIIKIFIFIPNWIGNIFLLGLLFYLAKSLRVNYKESRWLTTWKLSVICISYFIITLFVLLFVLFLGFWFV